MSKGLGGLIVAELMVDDIERCVSNRRERRASRHAAKASRARRWAGSGERRAARTDTPVARGHTPAFPEP